MGDVESCVHLANQCKTQRLELFPFLEELVLSDTPPTSQKAIQDLVSTMPFLASLTWRTRAAVTTADLFVMCAGLQAPHALLRLNFEGLSELVPVDDARSFVAQLVTATPSLESLVVPNRLFQTPLFKESVLSCFPSL